MFRNLVSPARIDEAWTPAISTNQRADKGLKPSGECVPGPARRSGGSGLRADGCAFQRSWSPPGWVAGLGPPPARACLAFPDQRQRFRHRSGVPRRSRPTASETFPPGCRSPWREPPGSRVPSRSANPVCVSCWIKQRLIPAGRCADRAIQALPPMPSPVGSPRQSQPPAIWELENVEYCFLRDVAVRLLLETVVQDEYRALRPSGRELNNRSCQHPVPEYR